MNSLEPIMERNFLEYASYVIVDRAIPDIRDGLKPVQRRILSTLFNMDDGKYHKVANVIGETMKLHPHGDASIGDALVVLANKDFFIEKQGNFGNPATGHAAAAPRYIECKLTELAKEALFSKALTQYQPSYDGRRDEPVFLPSKLPVILMLGTEGIAVGMATKIMPHNFIELLEAEIQVLRHQLVHVVPDFPTGGLIDVSEYDNGLGKVKIRARIEKKDDKTIVIREVPYSTTTESLIASIESASQKGKVKVTSIDDFTTDKVEIEIGLPRGAYADEVIPQLYVYTDCEVSISSNIVLIRNKHPVEMSIQEILLYLSSELRDQIGAELQYELNQLQDKKFWLALERIFVENRVYKKIETATTQEQVKIKVYKGLKPFAKRLIRSITDDDVRKLLEIPIRRISLYDMEKNKRDLEDNEIAIKKVERDLKQLTKTTIRYLKDLITKYKKEYPRRSVVSSFETVDVRAVARQNIRVSYDPETGFFGSEVKGSAHQFTVSEYDRFLAICKDGSFRIIGPEEKTFIPGKVVYFNVFDQEEGKAFTVIYRDKRKIAFAKKIHIQRFIRDREYELIKEKKGKVDHLLPLESANTVHLDFVPAKRQRVKNTTFELTDLDVISVTARGRRLAAKPVSRIKVLKQKPTPAEIPVTGSGRKTSPNVAKTVTSSKKAPKAKSDAKGQYSLFPESKKPKKKTKKLKK
ncbi:MAG: DNA topoisomerase IV subunit A [Proteobacteria bacterium]|nr:DNA topoisomerase IV subunit A [Pseudomonadota bacterium]